MVAANHDGGFQLATAHHFVEGQPQFGALTQADPADARRQALKADALAGHVQPVVQMGIVRDQFFDLGVGFVNVFGLTRQRDPTEGADTSAEQRADIRGYKARKVESVFDANIFGHLTNVIAVIEGRNAGFLKGQHGLHMLTH